MREFLAVSLAVFFALSLFGTGAQDLGAVDRAKAWNVTWECEDRIGKSYSNRQMEEAAAVNDVRATQYATESSACGGKNDQVWFSAMCSDPADGPEEERALVACVAFVSNFGDWTETYVVAEDFSLLSNRESYAPDFERSKGAGPEYDIASEPRRVRIDEEQMGLLVFELPADVANEDFVLQWTGAGPVETEGGELLGLQILVHDREPSLSEVVDGVAGTPVAPIDATGSTGDLTFLGASDDVIGPVDLDPGLYRVTARFSGDGNFSVWARQADGTDDLLFNELGDYAGEATFSVESPGGVVLEVEGGGDWNLQIEKLF